MNYAFAVMNIALSSLMFAVAGVIVKLVSADMSVLALVFWRNVFSFACVVITGLLSGQAVFKSDRNGLHAVRAFFSFLALLAYFYAIKHTELSTAVLLQQTSPIFVPVIAYLVMRRVSDRYVWAGTVLGFVGVAMTSGMSTHTPNGGDLAGIISGLMGGAATITIWMMTGSESPFRQMLFFSFYTLVFSLIFLPWVWTSFDPSEFPLLIALGGVTTLAQYFLSVGCASAPTDKIVPWTYVSVIFASVFGYIGWNEGVSLHMLSGMGLIVIGARISLRRT